MKNLFKLFFLIILLSGCSKDEDVNPDSPMTNNDHNSPENIFERTGCRPTDTKSIKALSLFTDKGNIKYLYGSKLKDNVESFWIAQYNSSGDQVWEIVNKDKAYVSHAYNPQRLSNGDIVVANVLMLGEITVKDVSPVIVTKNGKAKYIHVFDGYNYSDVHVFEDLFFCSISEIELVLNIGAKEYYVQIDNEGNILNQGNKMNIPAGPFAVWKNANAFVSISNNRIERKNVLTTNSDSDWIYSPILPSHSAYEVDAKFDKDTVVVNYKLLLENKKEEICTYKLSYSTGENYDSGIPESITFLDLEKPYIAPDSMTVTVHSIDVSKNEEGTTYYTVSYTLQNKTKSMTILEGIYEAFYNNNEKGEYQTGFFDKLYPGESVSRSYTFRSLSDKPYYFIHYKYDWSGNDADILKKSLKWKVKTAVTEDIKNNVGEWGQELF